MSQLKYDPILDKEREDDSDFKRAVLSNDLSLVFDNDLDLVQHTNEQ